MRILYDGYIFSAQRNGGISRYFASLVQRLPESWTPVIRIGDRPNSVELIHPRLKRHKGLSLTHLRPRVLRERLTRLYLALHDSISTYDILHPTYHFRLPERLVKKGLHPIVVTVFDMIPERYPAELDPTGREVRAKRSMIESADAIICVSENTKRELQEWYDIPDDRITVTYLAAGINRAMASKSEHVPERPYCLFIGNRGIYKNFARTLIAFAKIAEQWPHLTLCVIGESFNMNEVELIRALRLSDRVRQFGFVSDSQLASLYCYSEGLLYPSLHEGFGIPPLEAMACGTPVISSNSSSLPEVVGDAAIKVNPESVCDIAEAMLSLKDLGTKRDELIRRGFQQAARFDWDITAKRTIEVYKSVTR